VKDGGGGNAARVVHSLDHGVNGRAGVPDLLHDQHAPAVQQGIGRELKKGGRVVRLPLVVVVGHGRDEDVPDSQPVGEDPGRHERAPGMASMTSYSPATCAASPSTSAASSSHETTSLSISATVEASHVRVATASVRTRMATAARTRSASGACRRNER
jgi:hypothetical protein